MKEHELKTEQPYFDEVVSGRKTFEVRFNDRDFAVADTLLLREWDKVSGQYSGRAVRRKVTYIYSGPLVFPAHVILALSRMPPGACSEDA